MKKIYHLSTCNTCRNILRDMDAEAQGFELQDVKQQHISAEELDDLKAATGSYESLFNRRSRQYRGLGLHEQELTEADYRRYILQEYALLKRPIVLDSGQTLVGSHAVKKHYL